MNKTQYEVICGGVAKWNEWRAANPKEEIDLCGADLQHVNLIGADLKWANLKDTNLKDTNFSEANLICADLSGANLYKADLSKADLRGVNLYKADLRWSKLEGANLSEVNLQGAKLYGAHLNDVDLSTTDFSWANLYQANLREVDLTGAKYDMRQMVCGPNWYEVSDELCLELMRFDCAALGVSLGDMDKAILLFDTWKECGACPFTGAPITRPCTFKESRDLWSPGVSKSLEELWEMIVKEKEIKV